MKRFVLVTLCASIAVLGPRASAQPAPTPAKGAVSPQAAAKIPEGGLPASPAFLKLHESSKGRFEQIQSLISGIESRKLVHDGDFENLDKLMFEYANDFKAAFDQASGEADEASKSKGQRGSIQSLKTFEPRVTQIESKMRTGEIKLDKPILQKMSPSDLQEFRKFLTPSALQEMERLHPDLMKGTAKSSLARPEEPQFVAEAIPIPFSYRVDTFVANLINVLGPRTAEASLAQPCVALCSQQNWSGCASCILSKTQPAKNAWGTFLGCWNANSPCDWRHAGNCARRVGCLWNLISKLA